MTAAGLTLLLYTLTAEATLNRVPGTGTLPAIAATLLLLYPKAGQPRLAAVLSTALMRYLGRISYSLYLWHWPVLVFGLHYNAERALSAVDGVSLLGLALVLAIGSYHCIENPLRYRRFAKRRGLLAALGALSAISLGATVIMQSDGLPKRIYADGKPLLDRHYLWAWEPAQKSESGWAGHPAFGASWTEADQRIVLWGDSHAAHLAPILEQTITQEERSTAVVLASGCPPTIDGSRFVAGNRGARFNADCAAERSSLFEFLRGSKAPIDRVVITSAWATRWREHAPGNDSAAGYRRQQEALTATIAELKSTGAAVSVVGQVPLWPRDPTLCVAARLDGLWRRDCTPTPSAATMPTDFAPVHELLLKLGKADVQVLLPHQRLCDGSGCLTELAGEFLYRDADHLRRNLSTRTLGELSRRVGLAQLL